MAIKTCNVRLWLFPVISVLLVSSGCVHVDITVALHDRDFGATVTERLRITRTLKQMCSTAADRKKVMSYLTEEAAMQRLKSMGKGVTLKSHTKKDLPDGSSESICIYTVSNINNLIITNPYVYRDPASRYRFSVWVDHKRGKRDTSYGKAAIQLKRVKHVKRSGSGKHKAVTPLDKQLLRELQPVFADMVSDLYISLQVTVPTRFIGHHYDSQIRGIRGAPKKMKLFSVSGKDMDMSGKGFFENQEIMIKLFQMDLDNSLIQHHAANFTRNYRTPVLRSGRHQHRFWYYPTTYMINTYFGGKKPTK